MGIAVELVEAKQRLYQLLSEGKLDDVQEQALEIMTAYPQDKELEEILAAVHFWKHRQEYFFLQDDTEGGEELFQEWWKYESFRKENAHTNLKVYQSIKYFVFSRLMEILIEVYRLSPFPRKDILLMLGEVFLTLGMTERAIETLEYALSLDRNDEDIGIYILLGNAYADAGEEELASVMYNDAFYLNPAMIELEKITYPPIQKLAQLIKTHGVKRELLAEWIPVYAFAHGTLKNKREMSMRFLQGLRQRITLLEQTIKYDKKAIDVLVPRLINAYLWLLDYHLCQTQAKNNIQAVARKILDIIDRGIFLEDVRKHLMGKLEPALTQIEKYITR